MASHVLGPLLTTERAIGSGEITTLYQTGTWSLALLEERSSYAVGPLLVSDRVLTETERSVLLAHELWFFGMFAELEAQASGTSQVTAGELFVNFALTATATGDALVTVDALVISYPVLDEYIPAGRRKP